MHKIVILTSRGGQGLISGSEAIKEALLKKSEKLDLSIDVEIVDFFKSNSLVGNSLTELYNFLLRHSILLNSFYIKILHLFRMDKWKSFYGKPRIGLADLIKDKNPSAIIVTSQYLVSPISWAIKKDKHQVISFVGNLDPGTDCVPLWFSSNIDYHLIPTLECMKQYLRLGYRPENAIQTKLVIRDKFIELDHKKKAEVRDELGFNQDEFYVLFAGSREGYWGIIPMVKDVIEKTNSNLIVICGTNEKLKKEVENISKKRIKALGYQNDIHLYMKASDVIVSKPGKQTMKESVFSETPMISICFPAIMEQEKGNVEILRNRGIGFEAHSIDDLIFHVNVLQKDKASYNEIISKIKLAKEAIDPSDVANKILEKIKSKGMYEKI